MHFGEKIRQLREDIGLLILELTAKAEIDTALLSKIERSNRVATFQQVISISNALNIKFKELIKFWLANQITQLILKEPNAKEVS